MVVRGFLGHHSSYFSSIESWSIIFLGTLELALLLFLVELFKKEHPSQSLNPSLRQQNYYQKIFLLASLTNEPAFLTNEPERKVETVVKLVLASNT